jgi:hypothetical protein
MIIKKEKNEVVSQEFEQPEVKKIDKRLLKLIEAQTTAAYPGKSAVFQEIARNFINKLEPKDEIEALLMGQMLATNNLAMFMLIKGEIELKASGSDYKATNSAVKLLNAFTRQMQALENHRGKTSTQKIVVEQVKVESGGQAVVGNIDTTGGQRARVKEEK